jgi:hypothetical protein
MKVKEFNIFLLELSEIVKSLNQILYEIIILISFYFLFTNLKNNQTLAITNNTTSENSILQSTNKTNNSFIILIAILAICVDWFIWNNSNQTFFFTGILAIYIYYNLQNITIISTFINLSKDIYYTRPIFTEPQKSSKQLSNTNNIMEIPREFQNVNGSPIPFDVNSIETKEIHEVYKSGNPYVSITDTKYAEIMLNDLYNSSQYKNISNNDICTSLDNNVNKTKLQSDQELLDLFRNPQKIFLDNKWLNTRTYNDNCISCTHSNSNKKNIDIIGKNAICTIVPFGRELSECTNQNNTISPEQLEIISDNKVKILQM